VLTWHVHGNYLYYLTQAPHDFYLVTKSGDPPGYAGRSATVPWATTRTRWPMGDVESADFDVVLYQHRVQWGDPPLENPYEQEYWVDDPYTLLVHVTHFNRLMWDCGATPTLLIEHGVLVRDGVRYSGELGRGTVVVNHLAQRGRRLGADLFEALRAQAPLDLVGMDAARSGGIGEIPSLELAALSRATASFLTRSAGRVLALRSSKR
jgi:hypothetical protein